VENQHLTDDISSDTGNYHRLGDVDARKQAFSCYPRACEYDMQGGYISPNVMPPVLQARPGGVKHDYTPYGQYYVPQSQQAITKPRRAAGRGYAPQGTPHPPTNAQDRRPPNPSAPQEDLLIKDIETEITEAADEVRREIAPQSIAEAWPWDSNLICPMCKKQFRIGQIQYYKQHVDECEGV
jgi:hypothetical protein